MQYSIYQLLWLFLIYSFLGWCVEVSFVAVTSGKVVNRGFLNGPVCPIYGVGMLGALLLLEPVSGNLLLLFLLGMLLCTLVELIGGWVLERAFHTRWWDYSDEPFNLGGYICLRFSIMWGLAVTFAVRLIHPLIFAMVNWIPMLPGGILLGLLYGLFTADFVLTLITVIGLRKQLGELERVGKTLHAMGDTISDRVGNSALAADAKLESAKQAGQQKLSESRERLESAMEAGQQKFSESKEKLGGKLTGSLQELQQKKQALEQRQRELLSGLGEGARFGTRRLTVAFPNLRQEIRQRLEEIRGENAEE